MSRLLGNWRGDKSTDATYRLLARSLRLLILDGRVGLGVRLPGERELAQAIGLSRTTVTAAYNQLRDEGFLLSRQGSGSVTHLPGGPTTVEFGDVFEGEPLIDWTAAALPASAGLWQAYEEALQRLPGYLAGIGYEPLGLSCLREAIARDYETRGCPTRPSQIIVTSGAQNGLSLVLRALAAPGDRIAVDHPTYHNALGAILRHNCQPVPVSLPQEGWDIAGLDAAFRQTGPRFAYLIPDFHVPTGRLMDDASRRDLIAIASRTRTPLLIDETMAETGFGTAVPAAVASHDPEGHLVISLGSASKRYWGGMRIGWIRASEQRIAALGRLRAIFDMATSVLEQLTFTVMLQRGCGASGHRAEMEMRCDKLITLLSDQLPHWRTSRPQGGLALWAELPRPEASALAAMAQSFGLHVAPGPRFGVGDAFERFVRLPFTLPEDHLEQAVERLSQANTHLHRRAPHSFEDPLRAITVEHLI